MISRAILVSVVPLLCAFCGELRADDWNIRQMTHGPAHHFFGYIGHVGNTPWNGNGRYMVLLRTAFQHRMPTSDEAADIVLLDTIDDSLVKIEETRAWNPQQGTMLYWNPDARDTQFFFNDRDPITNSVFCVLFDIVTKRRIREYRFDDAPAGNSGVAQRGGFFLGLNYGRLDRLRRVTGYVGALDWTANTSAPKNDGILKVNVKTGKKALLVSFAELADQVRGICPDVDTIPLFINHTLWSRDDQRILFHLQGNWNNRNPRLNELFTIHADGTHLTRHKTFPGGHPEWGIHHEIIGTAGNRQIVYDVDEKRIIRELGSPAVFPVPEGDIALSPDGRRFVNGYKHKSENHYVVYELPSGKFTTIRGLNRGSQFRGVVRLDPSPCWRRDGKAIAVPAVASDGSRQTFVIDVPDPTR
jgi:hypothetical protein